MCGVPHLPTNATQAESLYLSGALHSAMRQGDLVEMFTHSALVNHGGGLKKEREIVLPGSSSLGVTPLRQSSRGDPCAFCHLIANLHGEHQIHYGGGKHALRRCPFSGLG